MQEGAAPRALQEEGAEVVGYEERAIGREKRGPSLKMELVMIDKEPVLDAYIGLLHAPEYVLYLGLRENAEATLQKAYPEAIVLSQRQFQREGLDVKYHRRVEIIE
jgi:hypothetical protein